MMKYLTPTMLLIVTILGGCLGLKRPVNYQYCVHEPLRNSVWKAISAKDMREKNHVELDAANVYVCFNDSGYISVLYDMKDTLTKGKSICGLNEYSNFKFIIPTVNRAGIYWEQGRGNVVDWSDWEFNNAGVLDRDTLIIYDETYWTRHKISHSISYGENLTFNGDTVMIDSDGRAWYDSLVLVKVHSL